MIIKDTIVTMFAGYIFGKVIEIMIRDFKKYGWRLPSDKKVTNKKRKI